MTTRPIRSHWPNHSGASSGLAAGVGMSFRLQEESSLTAEPHLLQKAMIHVNLLPTLAACCLLLPSRLPIPHRHDIIAVEWGACSAYFRWSCGASPPIPVSSQRSLSGPCLPLPLCRPPPSTQMLSVTW